MGKRHWGRSSAVGAAVALAVAGAGAYAADEKTVAKADAKAGADAEEKITYVKHIQPILKESCVGCHKAPNANARPPGGQGGAGRPGQGRRRAAVRAAARRAGRRGGCGWTTRR